MNKMKKLIYKFAIYIFIVFALQLFYILEQSPFTASPSTLFAEITKKRESSKTSLVLMTYNIENLFDTIDSAKTWDSSYLPLSKKKNLKKHSKICNKQFSAYRRKECLKLNWDERHLKIKMKRLSQVIKKVKSVRYSYGPDILFLQEVENYAILKRFRDEYLSAAKYNIIHFESRDLRGIDLAILSRLKAVKAASYHEIEFNSKRKRTRGIIHAPLYLPDGRIIHALNFHFPSQASSIKLRRAALISLNKIKKRIGHSDFIIAAGDSNITLSEEKKLYPLYVNPYWKISHQLGCRNCKGTSYYLRKKSWSFFDIFYSSFNLSDGVSSWQIKTESIRVFNPLSFQTKQVKLNKKGTRLEHVPNPYRIGNFSGVSDHWPVILEIHKIK